MKAKIGIWLSLALCSILAVNFTVVPVRAEQGPWAQTLHIKNYGTSEKEFLALESGEIDITDWPISKSFIDKWTSAGLVPSQITLRDYSEIGSYEYDIYNENWPTGVGDRYSATSSDPRYNDTLTWDPKTSTYKHYFDPNNEWDLRAWQFRLAIRYMVDMDYIKTEILKGYGMMMDLSFMPPAIDKWLDKGNLTNSQFYAPYGKDGLPYPSTTQPILIKSLVYPSKQDINMAKDLLNAAGFVVGADGKTRVDPRKSPTDYMDSLIFYIRSDHTERRLAGEKLAGDLAAIGVPVDAKTVAKTVAYKAVMVDYDYNIYTGGYSLGVDPTFLYGTFDSSQYWGAPAGSKYDGTVYDIGWSGGYQALMNKDMDKYLTDYVLYGATKQDVEWGVHNATYILNKYVGTIGLWSSAGVQGYRTGWKGVVNQYGYGISGPLTGGAYLYSFLNMWNTNPARTTINWGFSSNAENLSVVTAELVWDWNILGLIYDKLIVTNPYNPAEDWPWLATKWDVGEWTYTPPAPAPAKSASVINFTLLENATWHHGGRVTPEDVAFSLHFTRDAGPGVAWNYPGAMDIVNVETWDYTAHGGDWGVKVYLKIKSYYALHYVGWLPMFSKAVWMAASSAVGFGYTEDDPKGTFANRLKVRDYHPWKDNFFTLGTPEPDLADDGSGPWIYVGADSLLMEYFDLKANSAFFWTRTQVTNMMGKAFWSLGDVNRDAQVNIEDLNLIAHALLTTPAFPPGTGWGQWNKDADLNLSGYVSGDDMAIAGKSYGMTVE